MRSIFFIAIVFFASLGFTAEIVEGISFEGPGSAIEPAEEVRPLKKSFFKLQGFCSELAKYPKPEGEALSFLHKKAKNPCATLARENSKVFTKRKSLEYVKASSRDMKKYIAKAKRLKKKFAPKCCGDDSTCLDFFHKIPIKTCTKGCGHHGAVATYTRFISEDWFDLEKKNRRLRRMSESNSKMLSGEMALGRRVTAGRGFEREEMTIKHELAHACVAVKTQMHVSKGGHGVLKNFFASKTPPKCKLTENSNELYKDFLPNEMSPQVLSCIRNLSQSAYNKKSLVYTRHACLSTKMEEGFAEAVGIDMTIDKHPSAVLYEACDSLPFSSPPGTPRNRRWAPPPDHHHPAHVLECLLQYSDSFRGRLMQGLGC